jgi:hypothetical protein
VNTVTRKKITELIRLLEEMTFGPQVPGSVVHTQLNEQEIDLINEVIAILKGYLRVLIMLSQFRVTLVALFHHYPELFGEQDERGPYDT